MKDCNYYLRKIDWSSFKNSSLVDKR